MTTAIVLLALAAGAPEAAKPEAAKPEMAKGDSGKWTQRALAGKDIYATIKTNLGDVTVKLDTKKAPKTSANFVGLAAGEKEFKDPRDGKMKKQPYYDGIIFHRVIPNFMIQGGDPLGKGFGGPGYQFENENDRDNDFTRPGVLAMANAGPNTNGSQFFITVAPATYLANGYSVFGSVVSGQEVADAISRVERSPGDRPVKDVVIQKIALSETLPKK